MEAQETHEENCLRRYQSMRANLLADNTFESAKGPRVLSQADRMMLERAYTLTDLDRVIRPLLAGESPSDEARKDLELKKAKQATYDSTKAREQVVFLAQDLFVTAYKPSMEARPELAEAAFRAAEEFQAAKARYLESGSAAVKQ